MTFENWVDSKLNDINNWDIKDGYLIFMMPSFGISHTLNISERNILISDIVPELTNLIIKYKNYTKDQLIKSVKLSTPIYSMYLRESRDLVINEILN